MKKSSFTLFISCCCFISIMKAQSDSVPRLEHMILDKIRVEGAGERFVIKEFIPSYSMPGSMSIKQTGKNNLNIQMEFPGDAIPIVNNNPSPWGDGCIHRFVDTVTLEIDQGEYTFISQGDTNNRLTFCLLKNFGYIYLRGNGKVITKDGNEVKLGYAVWETELKKPTRADSEITTVQSVDYERQQQMEDALIKKIKKKGIEKDRFVIPEILPNEGSVYRRMTVKCSKTQTRLGVANGMDPVKLYPKDVDPTKGFNYNTMGWSYRSTAAL